MRDTFCRTAAPRMRSTGWRRSTDTPTPKASLARIATWAWVTLTGPQSATYQRGDRSTGTLPDGPMTGGRFGQFGSKGLSRRVRNDCYPGGCAFRSLGTVGGSSRLPALPRTVRGQPAFATGWPSGPPPHHVLGAAGGSEVDLDRASTQSAPVGIRVLVQVHRTARKLGVPFALAAPSEAVRKVFAITKLERAIRRTGPQTSPTHGPSSARGVKPRPLSRGFYPASQRVVRGNRCFEVHRDAAGPTMPQRRSGLRLTIGSGTAPVDTVGRYHSGSPARPEAVLKGS